MAFKYRSSLASITLPVIILLPVGLLTYFGIRLYLLDREEKQQQQQTEQLLATRYPYWRNAIDNAIYNDSTLWISPKEAQQLIREQAVLQKENLFLSVDSIMALQVLERDTLLYTYDYQQIKINEKALKAGEIIWDGKYIVNTRSAILGSTHNQTGYLLLLQHALQTLSYPSKPNAEKPNLQPRFFSGNIAVNDVIVNRRNSIIGIDSSGKYLIQLASRQPDATYAGNSDRIALPAAQYHLLRQFLNNAWLLFVALLVTALLYWRLHKLSRKNARWLSSLDKATCAIAIAEKDGQIAYVNTAFQEWNEQRAARGKNIGEVLQHAPIEPILQQITAQPGRTEYYYASLGERTVYGSLTYDADSDAVIAVDNDVSALRHMYDGELHALKNLIKEVKELNAQLILGKVPLENTSKALEILRNNDHSLEKALLFYANRREQFSAGGREQFSPEEYDLEIGLDHVLRWFESMLLPLHIRVETDLQGLSIRGNLQSIELVFQNALFNAIQAIREAGLPAETRFLRITARAQGNAVMVAICDSGVPVPPHQDIRELAARAQGAGLKTIILEMEKTGGQCLGFTQQTPHSKALQLLFPA
jgi:signal transduction histidine kinase